MSIYQATFKTLRSANKPRATETHTAELPTGRKYDDDGEIVADHSAAIEWFKSLEDPTRHNPTCSMLALKDGMRSVFIPVP